MRCNHVKGFTLIELLVVLGIITVLASIVLAVSVKAGRNARSTQCTNNLRQLATAFNLYASANNGIVPRQGQFWNNSRPVWVVRIATLLKGRPLETWEEIRRMDVLMCPEYPDIDEVPGHFDLNAFAFDSAPSWRGSPPTPLSAVRNAASLPWLVEAPGPNFFSVYFEDQRTVFEPIHLTKHIAWTRHRTHSNVAFADGHVERVGVDGLPLERFDDGIRNRKW
jgi:prepilin-type N-terminal cleavage/methylation domain-containing protein/prepilin-type processing-associated H-X9-DG protein